MYIEWYTATKVVQTRQMLVIAVTYMTVVNENREKSCMFVVVVLCNPSLSLTLIKSNHRNTKSINIMKINQIIFNHGEEELSTRAGYKWTI